MKKITTTLFLAASLGIIVSGCKKKEESTDELKASLSVPSTYVSAGYDANVATEAAVRKQLSNMVSYMKKGDNIANQLFVDSLNKYYSGIGNPSIATITQTYYKNFVENTWFADMAAASTNSFDPLTASTATVGGVYGGRLFNKRGLETLQEIEKGLFAAALYNHFIALSLGTIDAAAVDKMLCIFGAHPNFPNTYTSASTPTPDQFIANYMTRRDKNDGNGLYSQTKNQFFKLKAAVEAGSAYDKEKNEAIEGIKLLMEKGLMSTAIQYGYTAVTKLSKTSPSATDISGGLHDLSEAVGFVHGFKAVPQAYRKITDAQIDEILTLLNAAAGTDGEMYKFVTDGTNELPKVSQYQQKIKTIYNFSSAEMEDFKQNWVGVQGR